MTLNIISTKFSAIFKCIFFVHLALRAPFSVATITCQVCVVILGRDKSTSNQALQRPRTCVFARTRCRTLFIQMTPLHFWLILDEPALRLFATEITAVLKRAHSFCD